MVVEVGRSRNKKEKMKAIRKALLKHGDIPKSVVYQSTKNPNQWVAVFDKQGNVISAGRIDQSDWYSYTLKNLFTVPEARGKGLGTTVVKKLIMLATRRGAKVLIADITYDNTPSKKIMLNLGFKVVTRFKWAKNQKPADILHFVLYPPQKRSEKLKKAQPTRSRQRSSSGLGLGKLSIGGFKKPSVGLSFGNLSDMKIGKVSDFKLGSSKMKFKL